MTRDLTIEGITARSGERVRGQISVLELADGSTVQLPLVLINGAKPGPRLYIGAGIHGDEVTGIALVNRALAGIDPQTLSGSVVCCPVQQPLALVADHRLPISQYLKSPLDQAPTDAWTCFPGDADGNIAQVMAATLFKLIRQCDAGIDVHTPTRGGRYVPIAILPHMNLGDAAQKAERMAHLLGTGWIMRGDRGMYVSDGILCVEATKAGVPCLTFEIAEGGRLEEDQVAIGAQCVTNLLIGLGMIEGNPVPPPQNHVMREFIGLRANRGGLLVAEAPLGAAVKAGDVLCRILNVYGDEVETVSAPQDALLVRSTTLGSVSKGERVATLGLL
jgi:predicted deacylase